METTKDGFTFKRRGSNKKVEFECRKIKATDIFSPNNGEKITSACDENEFNFNVIRKKENRIQQIAKSKDTSNRKERTVTNKKGNFRGRKPKVNLVDDSENAEKNLKEEALKTYPKKKLRNKKQPIPKDNENSLVFNVVKKRKTIRMENDIDLSTNDSMEPVNEDEVESSVVNMNPGVVKNDSSIFVDRRNEGVLRMEIPTVPERLKSNEIHKKVASGSINDLIRECLGYLKDNSDYSKEIVRHCNSNYFSDVDYRKEIEQIKNRNSQIKTEIEKWSKVKDLEMCENEILVPSIVEENETEDIELVNNSTDGMELVQDRQVMIDEFNEKSQRLLGLEGKLRYFFENAKDKTENLLKNIFGSLEERSVDAMFLLKAMSKLGR